MPAAWDGLGWLLDKHCRLMRCYGWSGRYCWFEVTSATGWARYNWAVENEVTMFGPMWKLAGDGYVRQEAKRLINQWQNQEKLNSV